MKDAARDVDRRRPLVIWGASGHAKVVADAARLSGRTVLGFLDDMRADAVGESFCGALLLGGLAEWLQQNARRDDVEVALGVGDNAARVAALTRIAEFAIPVASIIHPGAIVATSIRIGAGCVIMAGAVVQADVTLGAGVIVNTRSGIDHDCVVGDGCHVSVNATLAGHVTLGELVTVGPGAVVCTRRSVGACTVVGAGAVVLRDLPAGVVAVGVPARPIRSVASRP